MSDAGRVLLWVTSLFGSGHWRRACVLADAMVEHGIEVCLVNGGSRPSTPPSSLVDFVQLPPVRAADIYFGQLIDDQGELVSEPYMEKRRRQFFQAFAVRRPDVFVTELFPLGRRKLAAELLPLLEDGLTSGNHLAVASVRDILVSSSKLKHLERARDIALKYYRAVLVHGDKAISQLGDTFRFAQALEDRIVNTGYVGSKGDAIEGAERNGFLVSAGSGIVGQKLIEVSIALARSMDHRGEPWHIVSGSNFPAAERARLMRDLPSNCRLHDYVDNLPAMMASSRVSISQAGYNTVTEAILTATPMILVPYAGGREDEQTRRAELLANRDMAIHLPEAQLSPETLAGSLDKLNLLKPTSTIDADGAAASARFIADLLRTGHP